MRLAALIALFALAACASRKPAYRKPGGRDYYSVNKSSVQFLGETFKQEGRLAKESFQRNWKWSEIRRRNARIQKESLQFLGQSFMALEWENGKRAWGEGLPREVLNKDQKDFWGSVRFGFLDSGN